MSTDEFADPKRNAEETAEREQRPTTSHPEPPVEPEPLDEESLHHVLREVLL